jgi:cyclophilin family peptidyl-prolyl cis-trans isomerase
MKYCPSILYEQKEFELKTFRVSHLRLGQRISLLVALIVFASLLLVACSGVAPQAPAAEAPPTEAVAAEAAPTDVPVEEPVTEVVTETTSSGAAAALAPGERNGMYAAAPPMTIDPATTYFATFKTDKGDIKVQLYPECAPLAVNNLVFLAREGYYDNTTFHRVLDGFMAQAGDPTGSGAGGPGYTFEDEFPCDLKFDRPGLLAMANAGPATNGSQFFFTFGATEWLNGLHTIFGEVVEGSEVLDSLTRRDPSQAPTTEGDKLLTVVIEEGGASLISALPTPLPTPEPFSPDSVDPAGRPLAALSGEEKANYFNMAPSQTIDPNKQYTATIKTAKGEMLMALHADVAPVAVNNFVTLANLGFFDGLPVNQVNPEELIVLGSPDNNPQSDAGYMIPAETNLPNELQVGSVAYVPQRGGQGGMSSSSQLLIALLAPPPEVNADFSFFGNVVQGVEVLAQLAQGDLIESVTISESE